MNERFYADRVSSSLGLCSKKGDTFNFRCNICGDSEKNSRKKRAYIFRKEDKWSFKCHNCGEAMYFSQWLKKFFPDSYRQYLMDNLDSGTKYVPKQNIEVKVIDKNQELIFDFYKDCKFTTILNNESQLSKDAIRFCEKRKIPEEYWKSFLVCSSGRLRNRMVIPFYNREGKIVYFQARKLYDHMEGVKYVSQIGEKRVYNLDFVNPELPVIAVEGPIDSMFIENAVAMIGTSNNSDQQFKNLDLNYILDNDVTGRQQSLKLLKKGKTVFNWKMFLEKNNLYYSKIKDINDLVLTMNIKEKLKFEDLKSYFTNSLHDSIYFSG